jgi:cyclase
MLSHKIGTRGILVSFDDPYYTNIYIIIGCEHVFVLDTFLGNDPMSLVKKIIVDENSAHLPIIIFNSHADYDHYWGNGAFENATIVGHDLCRKRILSEGKTALMEYASHKRGDVQIRPPAQTFRETLNFKDDRLFFFYTPGHTTDSSSCYDEVDKLLFVGDNIESPIPYMNQPNFDEYIHTLERYNDFQWKFLIAGHDPPLETKDLLNRNINYLDSFRKWSINLGALTKAELHRHIGHNLVTLREQLMEGEDRENFLKHLKDVDQYMM